MDLTPDNIIDRLFKDYVKKYNAISNKQRENLPRPLRLFDIKLRLALGIQINFDSAIAQTKTPIVKDCYVLLIKLAELWNAWEALLQYAKTIYPAIGESRFKLIELIAPETSAEPLRNGFDALLKLHNNKSFSEDFKEYTKRAKEQILERKEKEFKELMNLVEQKLNKGNDPLMRLIYMERNLFYHSGEAVKMGMKYSNRKKLLTIYYNAFEKYILTAVNTIL